ncbi:Uncharacterised protein [Mycobacteroides abscessus subsp. abscessus]|nr:Uncharacterised protein [Mycobacteroides abscessus subsp. abscessus]
MPTPTAVTGMGPGGAGAGATGAGGGACGSRKGGRLNGLGAGASSAGASGAGMGTALGAGPPCRQNTAQFCFGSAGPGSGPMRPICSAGVIASGSSDGRPIALIGSPGPSPSGLSRCWSPMAGGGPTIGGRSTGAIPVT